MLYIYIVRACLPHEQSPANGCGKHRPPCTDRSPLHGMEAREQVEEQYRQCTMDESMSTDHTYLISNVASNPTRAAGDDHTTLL